MSTAEQQKQIGAITAINLDARLRNIAALQAELRATPHRREELDSRTK